MNKKLWGILVCMLLIATSIGLVSATTPRPDPQTLDTEISITKPNGYVYVFNIQIAPLPGQMPFGAIIIGGINVQVDAVNESINKVEFYVDNELKATQTEAPYNWTWNERFSPPPIDTLKVVGYNDDTEIGSDELRVLYVNPLAFGP